MNNSNREIVTVCPASRDEWRQWLQENHQTAQSVWLVQYKKKTGKPTISWDEAVSEALCFGWIDSIRKTLDDEKFIQFFGKRKPNGTWSKVNKEKIKQLIDEGLVMEAGHASIAAAKKNGSWTILDEVEALTIPEDLEQAFNRHQGSKDFFTGLSKSVKKGMLQWIVLAKRAATRESRIEEVVTLAAQSLKPKQF